MSICALSAEAQTKVVLQSSSQARIGSATTLTALIINQSKISGPARLSIILPNEWLVESYPGETVKIKQSGNELKAIWLELPKRDTIKISALIDLPKNQKAGNYSVKSEFTYLQDGKKVNIISEPIEITLKKYFSRY